MKTKTKIILQAWHKQKKIQYGGKYRPDFKSTYNEREFLPIKIL